MTLFACIDEAPRDPILGITEEFNADTNPNKINLSIGVYLDETGTIPLLTSVQKAEQRIANHRKPHAYLPIAGSTAYHQAVQRLLFGDDASVIADDRVVTVQALGGTGALKLGADLLKRYFPQSQVAISDPSWENHRALFESAGFFVLTYRYYDPITHGIDVDGLLASLHALPKHTIVVLHACCHNPTGIDLSMDQWMMVIDACRQKHLIPFLDMAYQGFAVGVEADASVVRLFAKAELSFLVANSFSKSCALYGERVGALSIVTQNKAESSSVLSQIKRVIRTNYSNPPTYGSAVVLAILTEPELYAEWVSELNEMRRRIESMRQTLVRQIAAQCKTFNASFINQQRGMFSYSGLTPEQAMQLKREYGIYILSSGRICIAALNHRNINIVAAAIAAVKLTEGGNGIPL